jgi:nucleotide-binding universal stress UspA family protein
MERRGIAVIVTGVDGSRAGLEAVRWAAQEAALRGTALHVVNAMPAWACEAGEGPYAEVAQWMRDSADSVLREAVEQARLAGPGIAVSSERLPGDPRHALLTAAKGAELLVVGNHGLGGFRGLLLGSVALGVSGHAGCPVIVVRALPAAPRPKIVLGMDGARSDTDAVRFGFAEAARRGAALVVVHAVGAHAGPESRKDLPAEALKGWRERYPGVEVREEAARGHPVDVLLEASSDAELLVVGARGGGGFTRLVLGSVTHALLHHARCPVAIIPAGAAS